MNARQCLKASNAIAKGHNLTYAQLFANVICRGYIACRDSYTLAQWHVLERDFHRAQFLRWAAEDNGERRAYWVARAQIV
jgi:hypothetical protein